MIPRSQSLLRGDELYSILRVSALTLSVATLDVVLGVTAAALLWLNGGETVTTGPLPGLLISTLLSSVLVAVRRLLIEGVRRLPATRFYVEASVAVAETVVIVGLASWAAVSAEYFVGWIATFASAFSIFGSLVCLVGRVTSAEPFRSHTLSVSRTVFLSAEGAYVINLLTSVVAFSLLYPVHAWNVQLLNPLFFMFLIALVTSAVLVSAAQAAFARFLVRGSVPEPRRNGSRA